MFQIVRRWSFLTYTCCARVTDEEPHFMRIMILHEHTRRQSCTVRARHLTVHDYLSNYLSRSWSIAYTLEIY